MRAIRVRMNVSLTAEINRKVEDREKWRETS